jgi:large subunit ribosomal protein L17
MRHRNAGRKLNRNAAHRKAMFRNLAMALLRHERIITTVAKAKEMRPYVERLITLAKKGTLHARRLAESRLAGAGKAAVRPPEKADDEGDPRTILKKLFDEIAPRFKDRAGGYTRIIKRHERRLGDAGKTAYIELLKAGETKTRTRSAQSPAPVVSTPPPVAPPPAPAPTPPPPQAEAPKPEEQKAPETPPPVAPENPPPAQS